MDSWSLNKWRILPITSSRGGQGRFGISHSAALGWRVVNRLTNNGSFDPPRAFGLSRVGISAVCSSMMSVSEHPAVVGEAKAHQVCCTLLHSPPLVIAERGHQRGECRTGSQARWVHNGLTSEMGAAEAHQG
jgi:hypothetical protein